MKTQRTAPIQALDVEPIFADEPEGNRRAAWLVLNSGPAGVAVLVGHVTDRCEVVVTEAFGWEQPDVPSPDRVVTVIADRARSLGIPGILANGKELEERFAERRIVLHTFPRSEETEQFATRLVTELARSRRLFSVEHPRLRSELRDLSGGTHFAPCLATLAHAINDGRVFSERRHQRLITVDRPWGFDALLRM